jgi:hypothetical protein
VLTNPCYAGAFAFGRTRNARQAGGQGRPGRSARRPVPIGQWEALITGHHPGYITWEEYLGNQQQLHANCPPPAGQGGGAVREGRGLLQGLLRCGRCGRIMRTGYDRSGNGGIRPRYYCAAESTYLGRKAACCQSAGGRELEKAVLAEVFTALEPAALAATAQALADAEAARAERLKVFELAVERARYQAGRARRQYDACEPAGCPHAGSSLGGQAGRGHQRRGRAGRRAGPPAGLAISRRAELAPDGRGRYPGRLRRAVHHAP